MLKDTNINPFTPSFGSTPALLSGRGEIIREVIDGIENGPGDPHRAAIFIGPRGSGKTVLLSAIAAEAKQRSWISVDVTAIDGMLDDIIARIKENASGFLKPETKSHLTSLQMSGFGFSREVDKKASPNWRTQMNKLLNELNEQDINLLITVDEINVKYPELRVLAATFQHFVREQRGVALLMAGLPYNVSQILSDDSISFLRRSFQYKVGNVSLPEVKLSMKTTIELSGRSIDDDALQIAVNATSGFPFMIQLVGYHIWRQSIDRHKITLNDAETGIEFAKLELYTMIIERTIRELSETDIKFLLAMTEDSTISLLSDITERMNVTQGYASQYRLRLIEQGVISPVGRGKLEFAIPMLKEYFEERYSAE